MLRQAYMDGCPTRLGFLKKSASILTAEFLEIGSSQTGHSSEQSECILGKLESGLSANAQKRKQLLFVG